MEKTKFLRTKYAIKVVCKCGGCVAASMIIGGFSIDEDFTQTMAEIANDGGKLEIVNTDADPVNLGGCKC